jgi:hypothetical protein
MDGVTLVRPRLRALPNVSFGPYRLLEAVPWLMLASALRFLAYSKPAFAVPAIALASFAILLAFLLAGRRMIEVADGTTSLGTFTFVEQLGLARRILWQILVLLVGATILASAYVPELAIFLVAGFDGIAFDQFSKLGIVWSVMLATIVLLMVVRAGDGGDVKLAAALREFWSRALYLAPAIALLAVLLIAFSAIQQDVRSLVALFFRTDAPAQIKNLVYFLFVFGFATLRLWVTLAVLVFALRESYRHAVD